VDLELKQRTLKKQGNPKTVGGRMYNKYFKHQKGITGLETAIILIAFVVVAAVFAYTALSAGLFSTQKASEAVYSGLKEAQSTLELRGPVVATGNTSAQVVTQLSFVLSNALGGQSVDFTEPSANTTSNNGLADTDSVNKIVIKYIDANQTVTDLYWQATPLGANDSDDLLDPGEKFQIVIGDASSTANGGNLVSALGTDLALNTTFTIEIITPAGAVMTIERTTPARIEAKMNLY
jgi:archaeal flagellin FlaB